jgi:hypothetical protein
MMTQHGLHRCGSATRAGNPASEARSHLFVLELALGIIARAPRRRVTTFERVGSRRKSEAPRQGAAASSAVDEATSLRPKFAAGAAANTP